MQLGIARALVAAGAEVRVLASTSLRERVEATGSVHVPFQRAPDASMSSKESDSIRDWAARTPLGSTARFRDRLIFGPALDFALDVLEEFERHPVDVVAFDYLLLGAAVGAEKAGVPTVALIHNPYPLPAPGVPPFGLGLMPTRRMVGRIRDAVFAAVAKRVLQPGLVPLNAARRQLGLAPHDRYDAQLRSCDRLLVLTAPELDFASNAELPTNVRYVGPVLDGEPQQDGGEAYEKGTSQPFVVVSLGTTYQRQEKLARRVTRALGEMQVCALLTTGPAIDPGEILAPANVVVRRYVPHDEVMPHADLVVCHGGLGTVHAALAHGIPMVCMPHGRDQGDNAARVVAAGVGLRVSRVASVRRLRSTFKSALSTESLRPAAADLKQAIRRQDGAAGTVRELEALAGTRA